MNQEKREVAKAESQTTSESKTPQPPIRGKNKKQRKRNFGGAHPIRDRHYDE